MSIAKIDKIAKIAEISKNLSRAMYITPRGAAEIYTVTFQTLNLTLIFKIIIGSTPRGVDGDDDEVDGDRNGGLKNGHV